MDINTCKKLLKEGTSLIVSGIRRLKVRTRVKTLHWYDLLMMFELSCKGKPYSDNLVVVDCYEDFECLVGEGTALRIFESMMFECYENPNEYGVKLDREGGNWYFSNFRYFMGDTILIEFEVQDGNWNGTEIQKFSVTCEY